MFWYIKIRKKIRSSGNCSDLTHFSNPNVKLKKYPEKIGLIFFLKKSTPYSRMDANQAVNLYPCKL